MKYRCLLNADVYEMVMFMNVVVWLYEWVKEEQNLWYKQPNVNTIMLLCSVNCSHL